MTFTSPSSLSASEGGAPVDLDDATVPGKVVHENPSDSGQNHVMRELRVRNENAATQAVWWKVQGGSIPVPSSRSEMFEGDVPGTGPILKPTSGSFPPVVLLEPGYSLRVSTDNPGKLLQMTGAIDAYDIGGVTGINGYGGLGTTTTVSLGDISSGTWITVPFQQGNLSVPVNVTQDPDNNRLSVDAAGVWGIDALVVLGFAKQGNTDRTIFLRFWNESKGVEASDSPFPLYCEGGTNGGSFAIPTIPLDVGSDVAGDWLRLELGGSTNNFNSVSLDKAQLNVFKIG